MSPGSGPRQRAGEVRGDADFVGSIPDIYERLLVPLMFVDPARRLAEVAASGEPRAVLETAAGTGVLTRELRTRLPGTPITATDLNEDMLAAARSSWDGRPSVEWRRADAQALPFEDGSFDLVTCQFGVMFLPDKHAGFLEARRVLRRGGRFVFNVWDRLETNEFPALVHRVVTGACAQEPPEFIARTPYGYSDPARLVEDLEGAGFRAEVQTCDGVHRGLVEDVATAICQGTPLRLELDARPDLGAERATALVAQSLTDAFGDGVIEGRARWLQVVAVPLDGST